MENGRVNLTARIGKRSSNDKRLFSFQFILKLCLSEMARKQNECVSILFPLSFKIESNQKEKSLNKRWCIRSLLVHLGIIIMQSRVIQKYFIKMPQQIVKPNNQ